MASTTDTKPFITTSTGERPGRPVEEVVRVPVALEPTGTAEEKQPDEGNKNIPSVTSETASEVVPSRSTGKMRHKALGDRGRQKKFHQTIAMLETVYDDGEYKTYRSEDMREYDKEHYPEYFPPFNKTKKAAEKRLANRTKAARTRRDAERREIALIARRHRENIPDDGFEIVDLQAEREKRTG